MAHHQCRIDDCLNRTGVKDITTPLIKDVNRRARPALDFADRSQNCAGVLVCCWSETAAGYADFRNTPNFRR